MGTIKDNAQNWKPKPKIADFDFIDINTVIYDDGEGVNPESDKPYTYSYIELNGFEVRIPDSVIAQLKDQLSVNPAMRGFKVSKKGEGIMTKYTVIPIL